MVCCTCRLHGERRERAGPQRLRDLLSDFHHREILLTRPTSRTRPIHRDVFPPRPRSDPFISIPRGLIVNVAAEETLPFFEFGTHPTGHCNGSPYSVPLTPERISILP